MVKSVCPRCLHGEEVYRVREPQHLFDPWGRLNYKLDRDAHWATVRRLSQTKQNERVLVLLWKVKV